MTVYNTNLQAMTFSSKNLVSAYIWILFFNPVSLEEEALSWHYCYDDLFFLFFNYTKAFK